MLLPSAYGEFWELRNVCRNNLHGLPHSLPQGECLEQQGGNPLEILFWDTKVPSSALKRFGTRANTYG